jgi:hypothetical protein
MPQDASIETRPEGVQQRGYWEEAIGKLRQCEGRRERRAAIAKLLEQLGLPS